WIINDWWDVQLNSGGFYNKLRTAHLEQNTSVDFFNFRTNMISNFKLPHNFSAEIVGAYESKMNWGIWQFMPLGSLNMGLQKKLNNDKGTVSLAFNDILYTYTWQLNSSIPEFNITSMFLGDFHVQSVRLSFTRSFGNKKLRGVNIKSGSEELQNRVPKN
ncbi:MAG TPA: outer membrane beta-barrel protein, partial [Anditalea sp.]|nr:outer membrane beta-barrel protein [Anditalea sp.]